MIDARNARPQRVGGKVVTLSASFPQTGGDHDLHLVARDAAGRLVHFPGLRHPMSVGTGDAPGLIGYYLGRGFPNPFVWVGQLEPDGFEVRLDLVPPQVHRLDVVWTEYPSPTVEGWLGSLVRGAHGWEFVKGGGGGYPSLNEMEDIVPLK